MKLYRISTRGLGDFYVAADDLAIAEQKLKLEISKADYGHHNCRPITNIEILTSAIEKEYDHISEDRRYIP